MLVTLFALLLPVFLGSAWLNLLVPADVPARPALVVGCGGLLGLLLLPQLMRLLSGLGLGLHFATTAAVVGVLALIPVFAYRWRNKARTKGTTVTSPRLSGAEALLCAVLMALIGLRLGGLAMEIIWRPLFSWDATMHWATKAKVWVEYGDIVTFVSQGQWLELGGEGVYTDRHFNYPVTIPLLQAWMNLATGQWNESLMNLPWLLCLAALGLAFYGQLRLSGVATTTATVCTYFLLSLPLLNSHVALAGYADLFLGAAYGCALMSLHNWMQYRRHWLGLLTLCFSILCMQIKNEGTIWAMTLLPALLVAFLDRRDAAKLFALLGLTGLLLAITLPADLMIAGQKLANLVPRFRPEAIPAVIAAIWLHDSWHLAGYMLLILIPLGVIMPGAILRSYLGLSAALGCAVAGFGFLFLFTGFSWGAANFAAIGRLAIHLAPGLMFLCALVFDDLCRRGHILAPSPRQA